MPQILKEEVKQRIENSAVDVMLEKGLRDTDMRSIAKKAGITPGNLYRYFTNKDQLIISLTQPLIEALNEIVSKETRGGVVLGADTIQLWHETDSVASVEDYIYQLLYPALSNVLVDIARTGKTHPKRMQILLGDTIVSARLRNWVIQVITQVFHDYFIVEEHSKEAVDTLLKIFTVSFCEGVVQLLKISLTMDDTATQALVQRFVKASLASIKELIIQEIQEGNLVAKERRE